MKTTGVLKYNLKYICTEFLTITAWISEDEDI